MRSTPSPKQPTNAGQQRLRPGLGAFQFFTLAFGAVVGVGWVVVLGDWLARAGPIGAIVGLAAGGLVMVLIACCYAEMVSLLPVSGGEIAFAYQAFGDRMCFVTGWLLSLAYIVIGAFEAISVGWILSALVPRLQGPVLYHVLGGEVRTGALALGIVGMAALTLLNYRGARAAARVQDVVVSVLLVLAVVFISSGIVGGDTANLRPLFQRNSAGSAWPGILSVFMTASFWFGGFNVIPQAMEEKAADTALRRVGTMIVLSIVVGILFKTMVVLAASMTMPWQRLTKAELPVVAAFERAFHSPALARIVLVTALLGLVSTWNAVLLSGSRALFALGRAGYISTRFAFVHPRFGSPGVAVLCCGVLGAFATLLGRRALIPIVNVAAACLTVAYLLTCCATIRLRLTAPHRERQFRVPGGIVTIWIATIGAAFSFGLALYQPYADAGSTIPLEWLLLASWLAAGTVFWVAGRPLRQRVSEADRRRIIMGNPASAQG
jgi:basic amino acid/polyamine antiporter, APA family